MKEHRESKGAKRIEEMLSGSKEPIEVIDLISSDEEEPPRIAQAQTGAPSGATHGREDTSRTEPAIPPTRRTTSAPTKHTVSKPQSSGRTMPPPGSLSLNRTQSQPVAGPSTHSTSRKHPRSTSSERRDWESTLRRTRPKEKEHKRSGRLTRAALEKDWNEAAEREGARGIRIVNDIDTEAIPNVPVDFEWLERNYQYPADYQPDDGGRHCDCTGRCGPSSRCDCFDVSNLGAFGPSVPAYTKDGLLIDGLESYSEPFLVHECSDRCPCSSICENRVAQWPRDVPLEIIKTAQCGWGVRTPIHLPKGKILGMYTGDLSRRDEGDEDDSYDGDSSRDASSSDGDTTYDIEDSDDSGATASGRGGKKGRTRNRKRSPATIERQLRESYEFNLDWDEAQHWVVGAYQRGNWTRFVNHCCEPNLRVFSMTYDTDPNAKHLPTYLVFVTKTDIPANTELTVDYNPNCAGMPRKNMPMANTSNPEACYCGAAKCRGFMRQAE
ncbi:SET domain-containing protein [Peniophora sp. CONT]|nr:SET domain-containing protein [Peniophora sp. CONT]